MTSFTYDAVVVNCLEVATYSGARLRAAVIVYSSNVSISITITMGGIQLVNENYEIVYNLKHLTVILQ
jgi:hypothetical protein